MKSHSLQQIISDAKACQICAGLLPNAPKPVFSLSEKSQIVIIGQAPGTKVQASGIPWHDQSGKLLRQWLNVSDQQFYDPELFAIVPMGFCYPGKGKSGDAAPRKECAPAWHNALMDHLPPNTLKILIGQYSQKYYLAEQAGKNLTETVQQFEQYLPEFMVLPHPSPRNRFWLKNNPWFEELVLPRLQEEVAKRIKR